MQATSNAPTCPRILSLDGGGVRGLSSLLILRELMEEIGRQNGGDTPLPCQYFDLIGGTSTGGLIAIMLGRMRMSVDDCIDAYMILAKDIFKTDQVLKGIIPTGDDKCRFDYNILESAIKNIVDAQLRDENAVMENISTDQCPTFVVATPALNADGPPKLFRSYRCRGYNADKCAIWEAGRATTAAPTFFKPAFIAKPLPGQHFVDGGLAHNNPSELALQEVERIWPNVRRSCLVSIGTGRQKSIRIASVPTEEKPTGLFSRMWNTAPGRALLGVNALQNIADACVKLVSSSESVHQRVYKRAQTTPFPYFRFNVERDMDDIGLQEWEKMVEMGQHTTRYMQEGEGEFKRDQCVEELTRRQ